MNNNKEKPNDKNDCTPIVQDDLVDYQPIGKYLQKSNARKTDIDTSFFNMHASFLTSTSLEKAGGVVAVLSFLQACTYLEEVIDIGGDIADINQDSIYKFVFKMYSDGRLSVYRIHELVGLTQRFLKYAEQEGCKVQALVFPIQENIHN